MLGGSFATEQDLYERPFLIIPHEFSLMHISLSWMTALILKGLLNSIEVTLAGTVVAMALSATFAYPLSRRDFNGRATILNMVIVTMAFSGGLIPNYLLVKSLNMIDSYAVLIFPGAMSAFNRVIIKNFFEQIPQELSEPAVIDGCTDAGIFFQDCAVSFQTGSGIHQPVFMRWAIGTIILIACSISMIRRSRRRS